MGDVFLEQIVKRNPTLADNMKRAGLVLAVAIVFVLSFLLIPQLTFLLTVGATFGAYWLMSFLNVEYEYIFTNGELDIDAIYNKARRKRMYSGNIADFELMAHVEDKNHTGDFKGAQETKMYGSGITGDHTYAFLTRYNNKRVKIIFDPNDALIKAFSTILTPRKLFKKV